jgi:tight adherence protein B
MSADGSALLADVTGLLQAGLAPERAWSIVGVEVDDDGLPLLDAAAFGGDATTARCARAAAHLARDTGAPLAGALAAIDDALARVAAARDAAEAALAGPRMSARILRWLPAVGVALAAFVDPAALATLVTQPAGWALMAVALALTWAGGRWMGRMVAAATAQSPPARRLGPASRGWGRGHRWGSPRARNRARHRHPRADAPVPAPVVLALMDAALGSGLPVGTACERVAAVVDADTAQAVRDLAGAVETGEWTPGAHPVSQALARPLALAVAAGAPPRYGIRSAAARLDREERRKALAAAGELGVRLTLPLALCLLPAFALAGVVPLVIAVVAGAGMGGHGGVLEVVSP